MFLSKNTFGVDIITWIYQVIAYSCDALGGRICFALFQNFFLLLFIITVVN